MTTISIVFVPGSRLEQLAARARDDSFTVEQLGYQPERHSFRSPLPIMMMRQGDELKLLIVEAMSGQKLVRVRNCVPREMTIIKRAARPAHHNLIAVEPSVIERKNLSRRIGAVSSKILCAVFGRES